MTEVTCAVILLGDQILVAQRSESMQQPLKWEFPGGKIEPGETAEECLLRELREELNIEVEILEKLNPHTHRYDYGTIQLIPFLVRYVSGEIRLLEHKDYRWLQRQELPTMDWAPADVAVVEKIIENIY